MSGYVLWFKIILAYGALAAVNAGLANLGLLSLPFWAVPLVSAALNGLAEWLRTLLPASRAGKNVFVRIIKVLF